MPHINAIESDALSARLSQFALTRARPRIANVEQQLFGKTDVRTVGRWHPFTWFLATFHIDEQQVEAHREGVRFVGGSFANCRTYSSYMALQIKAIEEGLLPKR